jgi:hypothetical protein
MLEGVLGAVGTGAVPPPGGVPGLRPPRGGAGVSQAPTAVVVSSTCPAQLTQTLAQLTDTNAPHHRDRSGGARVGGDGETAGGAVGIAAAARRELVAAG